MWHILNKYYRAEVSFYPVSDGEPLPPELMDLVEAHIIYILDTEVAVLFLLILCYLPHTYI